MGEKIIVGPVDRGLRTDRTPFVIDNDSFPTLLNAYQWRGRVKRKRGTATLGRLSRFFDSTSVSYNPSAVTITFDGSGNANLLTAFSLQTNGNIVPGSVTIVGATGPVTYTDPTRDGYLTPTGTSGPNTINYSTGAILIPAQAGSTATAKFIYNPDLPVMGLEDLALSANQFPGNIGFDPVYSYNILPTAPYSIYDVSFYKNPSTGTYPSYVHKTNPTPTTWNGQDYQQFWTTNYEGALWTTNGINVPFSVTNVGMQYNPITGVTIVSSGPPAVATLTIVGHGLVIGDFVFVNEVGGITGINFQTGYVISVGDADHVNVEFPNATLGGMYTSGGIAQYLTNRSDVTKDCLRWYDGDPTNGVASAPVLNQPNGWVNFAPPLSQSSFAIDDNLAQQYYLVGCLIILPFKDRLLFIGPVIQTSTAGSQIYLPDTVIFSQAGTPYYTCSFTGDVDSATTEFTPILTPTNKSGFAASYFEDQTGFGGYATAGLNQPITTASYNEDVVIMGFTNKQVRFVYSGNDVVPFNFFIANSELGSGSTFSTINLDRGVVTIGEHGIIKSNQVGAERIDLDIPDQVFQFNLIDNGPQRVCAQRDFVNEWIYFTYLSNEVKYIYPNQTLQYNYRDNSWAIFNECYTTYGIFRRQTGYTWATIGMIFPTWGDWNEPWGAGSTTLLQPQVLAGNQQGFVLTRDEGTGEGNSLTIQSFSGNTVTSPNHCLNMGDYIVISGCLGTIGSQVNGNIFSVGITTTNTFMLDPSITSGTYFGGGLIKRMYVPYIQTKQFPSSWGIARKTRLGPQQYLLTTTANSQITLLIFLSQAGEVPFNFGPVVPEPNSINNSLVYSTVLYTCPESTNLGLTPANINLQMVTALNQEQIWHRMNTSLLGDTIQVGFTMSDAQMRAVDSNGRPINAFEEIELHAFILDVSPSMVLA